MDTLVQYIKREVSNNGISMANKFEVQDEYYDSNENDKNGAKNVPLFLISEKM